MDNNQPKIFRDPVHNIISFDDSDCDKLLLNLINTKEFQRLRRIKQLGMCDLVFPGANHSRFAHSIGVMHTARMCLDQFELSGTDIDPNHRTIVLAAALLHDIGHGPFSHAFEKVTGIGHEKLTRNIILDETTEIHKELIEVDKELPKTLASFYSIGNREGDGSGEENTIPNYLTHIVSSQLDGDRFDYLLRDSHATGTDYGNFDLQWLIKHLHVDEENGRLFVDKKAYSATEAYIFARYHMYKSVYFHKAVRAAEIMLELVFKRYKELLEKCDFENDKSKIVLNTPEPVFNAFSKPKEIKLCDYLLLDDYTVTEFLKACIKADDAVLRSLGDGLVNRKLYKCKDVSKVKPGDLDKIGDFKVAAKAFIHKEGLLSDYAFIPDTASNVAYKGYDPDDIRQATQIYIEMGNGEMREISRDSEPIYQLTKKFHLLRYYYPENIRNDIEEIAESNLT